LIDVEVDINPLVGYNFDDFFTKKESWQHTYDYLNGNAITHGKMNQSEWCRWTHSNLKFNDCTKCRIIFYQVEEVNLYAIVGVSDVIPISTLLAANSMDPTAITSRTESMATMEEVLKSISSDSRDAKLFMEESLDHGKPLVLQLTAEKTINFSVADFRKAVDPTILVHLASLVSTDLFPYPCTDMKDEITSTKSSVNALSSALTNLTQVVSSAIYAGNSENLGIADRKSSDHELRKLFGPMHEAVMRDRTILVEGYDWAQSKKINDFDDLMHFVGNGIGATKRDIDDAKESIIELIVRDFSGIFDNPNLAWNDVYNRISK
jgi:hypothetical protein